MKFYLLTDTIPQSIFCYVGQTASLKHRLEEHFLNHGGSVLKRNWINYVKVMGGNLNIKELDSELDFEKNYISLYKQNNHFISLNSATDLSSSDTYSEDLFGNSDFKNRNYKRAFYQTNYFFPRYKQNRKLYITAIIGCDLETSIKKVHDLIAPYDEESTICDVVLEKMDSWKEWSSQDLLVIRDLMLYNSSIDKKFYFDLYSRLLVDTSNFNLKSDIKILQESGLPYYKGSFDFVNTQNKLGFSAQEIVDLESIALPVYQYIKP